MVNEKVLQSRSNYHWSFMPEGESDSGICRQHNWRGTFVSSRLGDSAFCIPGRIFLIRCKDLIMKNEAGRKKGKTLPLVNRNAAGIDVGSRNHYAAVPADRDESPVRVFSTYTSDLHSLALWLKECGIDTVAMESTGVYWIPVFQILEQHGLKVCLVNARHAKNVPGRKSDVRDCQWLQQLHSFGLLAGSFQPDSVTRELRTYLRQRDMLVHSATSQIQHMQKSLIQMNLLLHNAISDITGASGMAILRAIIKGERDPEKLIIHCRQGLKNSEEVIKKSLTGTYAEEHIFTLTQAVELYDFYQAKIAECEERINSTLRKYPDTQQKDADSDGTAKKKKKSSISPEIKEQLKRMTGVDLTQIDGMNTLSAVTVISETGTDMSKWKTEKHFTSWLGLSPDNRISGGKILKSGTKKIKSRASRAFRHCAQTLHRSKSYMGAYYRKMRARLGPGKANVAAARKLAVIFYTMLKTGTGFKDLGFDYYEKKYKERSIASLKDKAEKLGYSLILNAT